MGACESSSACDACCGDTRNPVFNIVVLGAPRAGTTTIVRQLRHEGDPRPRPLHEGRCEERWAAVPMPSVCVDAGNVPVRRDGRLFRFIDGGPCTSRPPKLRPTPVSKTTPNASPPLSSSGLLDRQPAMPDSGFGPRPGNTTRRSAPLSAVTGPEAELAPHLATAKAVIVVLDASRSLSEQDAASVFTILNRSKAAAKPLVVLLTKYDLAHAVTLPTFLSPQVVSSALSLTSRDAPWACEPCIATHRRLCMSDTLRYIVSRVCAKSGCFGARPTYGSRELQTASLSPDRHAAGAPFVKGGSAETSGPNAADNDGARTPKAPAEYVQYTEVASDKFYGVAVDRTDRSTRTAARAVRSSAADEAVVRSTTAPATASKNPSSGQLKGYTRLERS